MSIPYNKVITEYEFQIKGLKLDNDELKNAKEVAEKNYQILMNDNHALNIKLENLENVFIGNPIQKGDQKNQQALMSDEYMASNVGYFEYPWLINLVASRELFSQKIDQLARGKKHPVVNYAQGKRRRHENSDQQYW
jgi:kinesin family protein 12